MAGKLASLIIKISANGAEAEKELKKLERKMSDFSKNLKKLGTDMSKYITAPITAMAGVSVAAANTQLQAEAKLLNALQGRSDVQQRLIKQAGELQSRSTLGDEAIIEQQAYLAALGLSEQQIGATIEAAAQLSVALNMDLGSAVKNLGKTFGGMTGELGESIPALKNLTKEQLQAGEAVNYVNQNYRGFAEAAAAVGTGPLTQLKNIIGDIAESFGTILLPTVQKLANKLKEMATAFQNLSPQIKNTIVTVAAVAAGLGPAIVAFSKLLSAVKLVSLFLPALGVSLTAAATGPITVITAAVVALATAWAMARSKMNAYMEEEGITDRGQARLSKKMYEYYKEEADEKVAQELIDAEKRLARARAEGHEEHIYNEEALVIALSRIQRERAEITAEASATAEIEDSICKALEGQITSTKALGTEVKKVKSELSTINVGGADLSSLSTAPSINLGTFDQHLSESIGKTTAIADFREYWESLRKEAEKARSVGEEIATVISTTFANMATALGEGLGDLFTGGEFDPGKTFLEVLGKSLQQLGAALITYATAMESFKKSLSVIFNNPGLAIIAGIAAIATGKAFVNLANTPPKLASGGLAYGPTLAVVGDNRGAASDPEVIAPLSKLRNYIGGQQLQLVGGVAFELRGDVVRAVLDRENFRLNRKG